MQIAHETYANINLDPILKVISSGKDEKKIAKAEIRVLGALDGDFEVKLHTKRNNVTHSKTERQQKQDRGIEVVLTTLQRQTGCSEKLATILFDKVSAEPNRVTFGEAKILRDLALSDKLVRNIKDIATDNKPVRELFETLEGAYGKPPLEGGRFAKRDLGDRQTAILDHCRDLIKNHGQVANAFSLCKEGKFEKASSHLEQFEKFITNHSKGETRKAMLRELEQIKEELKTTHLWEGRFATPHKGIDPKAISNFLNQPPELLFKECEWQKSKTGANGAVIVKGPKLEGGGAVVKLDKEWNAVAGKEISDYIHKVGDRLHSTSEGKLTLPLEGMVLKTISLSEEEKQSLCKTILPEKPKDMGEFRLKTNVQNFAKDGEKSDCRVTVSMFVQNSKGLDQLDPKDKVALCKGGHFPSQLGQAAVLGRMLGLGDHMGLYPSDGYKFPKTLTNAPNFMINMDSGKLTFIDYAQLNGGKSGGMKSGYKVGDCLQGFECLAKYANRAFSKENIPGTLKLMSEEFPTLIGKEGAGSDTAFGPLKEIMALVTNLNSASLLFGDDEKAALQRLTTQDRVRFAANVVLGALDGMDFLAKNIDCFTGGEDIELPFEDPESVFKGVVELNRSLDEVRDSLRLALKDL